MGKAEKKKTVWKQQRITKRTLRSDYGSNEVQILRDVDQLLSFLFFPAEGELRLSTTSESQDLVIKLISLR